MWLILILKLTVVILIQRKRQIICLMNHRMRILLIIRNLIPIVLWNTEWARVVELLVYACLFGFFYGGVLVGVVSYIVYFWFCWMVVDKFLLNTRDLFINRWIIPIRALQLTYTRYLMQLRHSPNTLLSKGLKLIPSWQWKWIRNLFQLVVEIL